MRCKIFDLDNEKSYRKAEKFKKKLENKGISPKIGMYGFYSIKISW